jgi:hypothetical protein
MKNIYGTVIYDLHRKNTGLRDHQADCVCAWVPVSTTPKLNYVALVREWTIATKRPPLIGEVSANFCW